MRGEEVAKFELHWLSERNSLVQWRKNVRENQLGTCTKMISRQISSNINKKIWITYYNYRITHGKNFVAIFILLSVVVWISLSTLWILTTLVNVITMRVGRCDWLTIAKIALSTSIRFCYLCYIQFWTTPLGVVKIAIQISKLCIICV